MKWTAIVLYCILISSYATKIYYVMPNDSTNTSCPSQPCDTFSHYLQQNDNSMPTISNVEYRFLPGEHNVTKMVVRHAHNISLLGMVEDLSPVVIKLSTYFAIFDDCTNVSIAKLVLEYSDPTERNDHEPIIYIVSCVFCIIEHVTLNHLMLYIENMMGKSYLDHITINIDYKVAYKFSIQHGILIIYTDDLQMPSITNNQDIILVMNSLIIRGINCEYYQKILHSAVNVIAMHIGILSKFGVTVIVQNSIIINVQSSIRPILSTELHSPIHKFSHLFFERFTFKNNKFSHDFTINKAAVDIKFTDINTSISFIECYFLSNLPFTPVNGFEVANTILLYAVVKKKYLPRPYVHGLPSIMTIKNSKLEGNGGVQLSIRSAGDHKALLYFCENVSILYNNATTFAGIPELNSLMYIEDVDVIFNGTVIISKNTAYSASIIAFQSSRISFYSRVEFSLNNCTEIISLQNQYPYIIVAEHANITFVQNVFEQTISVQDNEDDAINPLCLFQYMSAENTNNVSPSHFCIIFINNRHMSNAPDSIGNFFLNYYTSHCRWLPFAAFHVYHPKEINQQIIKIYDQGLKLHSHTTICYCSQFSEHNCTHDTLGPIHPGQRLQVGLSVPYNNETSIVYAETHSASLPNSACKIAHQSELVNTLTKQCKVVNFTIVSTINEECELFLTAQPDLNKRYDVFHINLLPCPVGFVLINGICECDPILNNNHLSIKMCHIDDSTIQRPANRWIKSDTISNDIMTTYFISICPMDYCLPHSSHLNLATPDLQCQFNRSGILCSQCQHGLSMVFGSSRCMKCTNVHILITLIVIVAGIVLVVLLYLLNLTVTNGTINGIIFYANIVSINDPVFLVNDTVFMPLKVFISFTNLDLGIETCYYNGMDSYAKVWLQLFFPLYLILIATFIIIASRYSSRILRWTYTRSLPVLATLFLLSYTGILRAVSTVLFSYSTITELPSGHQQVAWSVDASVPLFGAKFTILFITCSLLFLVLIPFNIILLFTRYLLRFKTVYRFVPLLDAFQGSYKIKHHYWSAIYIIVRNVLFAVTALSQQITIIITTFGLLILTVFHGYIHPNKNKSINIQELILLVNLTILYTTAAALYNTSIVITVNVMIGCALLQFSVIVLYHFVTFALHWNIIDIFQMVKGKLMNKFYTTTSHENTVLFNIPERTFNYNEYREGLTSDDFI